MSKFIGFFVFIFIWINGAVVADYVFEFETNSYCMLWGYVIGVVSYHYQKRAETAWLKHYGSEAN